jgi:hypothetical protein
VRLAITSTARSNRRIAVRVGVDASSASGDPADVGIQQFALTGVDGSTNLDA